MRKHLHLFYIGTYGKGQSRQIFQTSLDEETGQLTTPHPLADALQSSYLAQGHPGQVLSILKEGDQGGLAVFDASGQRLDGHLEAAPPPCHIRRDDWHQLVYTCNYHTGDVCAYQLSEEGQLHLLDRVSLGQGSHPHSATVATDGIVIVCALGLDSLIAYKVMDGRLTEINRYQFPSGTGPRHLLFHPKQKLVYVVGERNNSLTTLFYDGQGVFDLYETKSTLPDQTVTSHAAAIVLAPSAQHLYVSNRGHDSITLFRLNQFGTVGTITHHALSGQIPRDMCLSPSGQYLLVACQNSHTVHCLAIDQESGELTERSCISVPEAVAIMASKRVEISD